MNCTLIELENNLNCFIDEEHFLQLITNDSVVKTSLYRQWLAFIKSLLSPPVVINTLLVFNTNLTASLMLDHLLNLILSKFKVIHVVLFKTVYRRKLVHIASAVIQKLT